MWVRKRWLVSVGLVLVIAYLASGIYFVQPDERGVVRWFGRATESVSQRDARFALRAALARLPG